MCGIIGVIGFENPKDVLIEGLRRLEYRGYDSTGIAILEPEGVEVHRAEGKLSELEKKVKSKNFKGAIGIGHTRWATHGAPNETNAHPHHVGHITLVHNGIIENYNDLKKQVLSSGRILKTETDTEVIAHLLDIQVTQGVPLEQALSELTRELKGSYAFVILCDLNPDIIFAVKNGVPLMVGLGEKENYLISDVQGILHRTKKIVYPSDNDIILCSQHSVSILDQNLTSKPYSVLEVNWDAEQAEKGGYEHFMLKEIFEQPVALANTIEDNIDQAKGLLVLPEIQLETTLFKGIRKIHIAACGTAMHAGLVGKFYLEKFAGIPCDVEFASEFRYRDMPLDETDLVILISQSGETADTLGALREAKRKHAKTLGICNVRNSTLHREVSTCLFTDAGPEIGVASTKAFTTQLCVLYMFAVHMGVLNGNLKEDVAVNLTQDLLKLPHLAEKCLGLHSEITQIVKNLPSTVTTFFYVGRNNLYPIALEGALKLKEISYLHAEGYPAGELKHGPIALIDSNVVCFVFAHSNLLEKTLSNIHEIKARKAQIIGVGNLDTSEMAQMCPTYLEVPLTTWGLNPILQSIPIQLFAYEMAKSKETDIDKPRNLAKSVTVE